jgi:adenylate cyclase
VPEGSSLRQFSPWFWLVIALTGAVAGILYNVVDDDQYPLTAGAVYGGIIAVLVTMHERGLLLPGPRNALQRLPTALYLVGAEILLLLVVVVAMAFAGFVCLALGLGDQPLAERIYPSGEAVVYSLVVSGAVTFVLRMRDLIGAETFANFMIGRYHRPVKEERAFLFLDVEGSTAYAERHGDLAAQALLGAVFAAIAAPIRRHGGRVDDYVGDLAIVSWPLKAVAADARCVSCVFAIFDALAADEARWRKRFGHVPKARAALHGGSVVTAEVGIDRHKIAYFGDVMNSTSRLEALCRETGEPFLISESLLGRLPQLPPNVVSKPLGTYAMRGREKTMAVFALRRAAPPSRRLPAQTARREPA